MKLDKEKYEKAKEILTKYHDMLQYEYGLDQCSIGFITKDGKYTDEIGITCFVDDRQRASEKYDKLKDLPEELEGIKIELVKIRGRFNIY